MAFLNKSALVLPRLLKKCKRPGEPLCTFEEDGYCGYIWVCPHWEAWTHSVKVLRRARRKKKRRRYPPIAYGFHVLGDFCVPARLIHFFARHRRALEILGNRFDAFGRIQRVHFAKLLDNVRRESQEQRNVGPISHS